MQICQSVFTNNKKKLNNLEMTIKSQQYNLQDKFVMNHGSWINFFLNTCIEFVMIVDNFFSILKNET